MKSIAVAILSALTVAIMMCAPVSAKPLTVSFEDPQEDIGPHAFFSLPTDPVDKPTTSSPICQATYFDLVRGWVTLKNSNEFELGLETAGVVDESMVLPPAATGALWVWYFYDDIEYYADCVAVVSWDGEEFEAYFKDKSEMGAIPYPYWEVAFEPDGTVVRLTIDSSLSEVFGLLSGMNYWFAETKIWFSSLVEPYDDWALPPDVGGWFAVDINDWDPSASELPWLPMP